MLASRELTNVSRVMRSSWLTFYLHGSDTAAWLVLLNTAALCGQAPIIPWAFGSKKKEKT